MMDLFKLIKRHPVVSGAVAVGAGALLLGARPAHADTGAAAGAAGSGAAGAQLGDAHRSLAAGTRVRMPGSWHLRPSASASNAGGTEYPGGAVVVIVAPAPSMRRGSQETGYRVRDEAGHEGYAFVPYNATRA
ncbi:MAG TPA: hypothetical protein VHH11_14085 [Gammaproteobacteria bacterium]|nr:hypothetical protein [Gammaproteobacteria bacterium]